MKSKSFKALMWKLFVLLFIDLNISTYKKKSGMHGISALLSFFNHLFRIAKEKKLYPVTTNLFKQGQKLSIRTLVKVVIR